MALGYLSTLECSPDTSSLLSSDGSTAMPSIFCLRRTVQVIQHTQRESVKLFHHWRRSTEEGERFHHVTSHFKRGSKLSRRCYKKTNMFSTLQTSINLGRSFRIGEWVSPVAYHPPHNYTIHNITTEQYTSSSASGENRSMKKKANILLEKQW